MVDDVYKKSLERALLDKTLHFCFMKLKILILFQIVRFVVVVDVCCCCSCCLLVALLHVAFPLKGTKLILLLTNRRNANMN